MNYEQCAAAASTVEMWSSSSQGWQQGHVVATDGAVAHVEYEMEGLFCRKRVRNPLHIRERSGLPLLAVEVDPGVHDAHLTNKMSYRSKQHEQQQHACNNNCNIVNNVIVNGDAAVVEAVMKRLPGTVADEHRRDNALKPSKKRDVARILVSRGRRIADVYRYKTLNEAHKAWMGCSRFRAAVMQLRDDDGNWEDHAAYGGPFPCAAQAARDAIDKTAKKDKTPPAQREPNASFGLDPSSDVESDSKTRSRCALSHDESDERLFFSASEAGMSSD